MDTVIWLLSFLVTHGYAMVLIAGFSSMGLLVMSFRLPGATPMKLQLIRDREGLPEVSTNSGPTLFARPQCIGFRVLAVVMLWSAWCLASSA